MMNFIDYLDENHSLNDHDWISQTTTSLSVSHNQIKRTISVGHEPKEPIETPISLELNLTPPCCNISTPNISVDGNVSPNNQIKNATSTLISNVSNELIHTQSDNEDPDLMATSISDETNKESTNVDLETFYNLKSKNFKNPCIAYLNINSLRGDKFTQLKEMLSYVKPEILCIDETKLTSDFSTAQFHIDGYHYPPFRRDRPQQISSTYYGGGKLFM